MNIKAVLFDMDGTLLPMEQKAFTGAYFKELGKKVCPIFGIDPEALTAAVWKGTKAMIVNDGSKLNMDAFWETFEAVTGLPAEEVRPVCDKFYINEFENTRAFTKDSPLAVEALRIVHEKGLRAVLATNPLFPMDGQLTRLHWTGLGKDDFEFITAYDTDSYCKPSPDYYRTILNRLGLEAEECLMIGNDIAEDMLAASSVGINCYLLTDCVEKSGEYEWNGAQGSFAEMVEMLKDLNS